MKETNEYKTSHCRWIRFMVPWFCPRINVPIRKSNHYPKDFTMQSNWKRSAKSWLKSGLNHYQVSHYGDSSVRKTSLTLTATATLAAWSRMVKVLVSMWMKKSLESWNAQDGNRKEGRAHIGFGSHKSRGSEWTIRKRKDNNRCMVGGMVNNREAYRRSFYPQPQSKA